MPSGVSTYRTGEEPERNSTPWCCDGRKPADQVPELAPTPAAMNCERMTT